VSTTVDIAFARQFDENVVQLAQQMGSRLRGTVRIKEGSGASATYFDRLASASMAARSARHQPTYIGDIVHSRRRSTPTSYERGELIDEEDEIRTLINPQSEYASALAAAANRQIDDIIITALGGNADSIDNGLAASTVALGSGQKIAASVGLTTGLNINKLTAAKKLLDGADVPEDERYLVVGAAQLQDALNTSQITSVDYAAVKALVAGQVDTFLGFKWIRSERLSKPTTDRLCYAFQKNAVGLTIAKDIYTSIDKRADLSNSLQVLVKLTMGAVRIEEARVVEISCTET